MHDTDFALGKQIPIFEFDTEDELLADFRHTSRIYLRYANNASS